MNYPSKGISFLVFMVIILVSVYSFSIFSLVYGLARGITLQEIPFLILFYTLPTIAVFLLIGHKFVYKPIKYYEKTYGKTGLGDKYIEKL